MLDLRSKWPQIRFFIIKVMYYAFKIIGLAPFSIQTKKSAIKSRGFPRRILVCSKMGMVYNFLFAIVQCSASTFAMYRWYLVYVWKVITLPKYLVYTVVLLVNGLASVNVIIRWAITQKTTVRIMNRLSEVDSLLRELKNPAINKKMIIWLVLNLITTAYMACNLIITFKVEPPLYCKSMFISALSSLLAPTLSYYFMMQYVIILGLVNSDFERVNENLLSFKKFQDYSSLRPFLANYSPLSNSRPNCQNCELAALQLLRAIRTALSELTQDIADWYSFPILPVMTCCLLSLLDTSYACLMHLTDQNIKIEGPLLIFYITWYTFHVHPPILLSAIIRHVLDRAKTTASIINAAITTSSEGEVKTELEDFSLQLLSEDLEFTAYGTFALDNHMLHAMLGSTVTYCLLVYQAK